MGIYSKVINNLYWFAKCDGCEIMLEGSFCSREEATTEARVVAGWRFRLIRRTDCPNFRRVLLCKECDSKRAERKE